ncbi:MAG: glycosyltransferase [Bacteroidaceae bacterium]|nr:glycosyltransferase [Bacteroidaceae bacterium]
MNSANPHPPVHRSPERLSIVVCTHNGSRYLAEQLDSLLRQTLRAEEIIIQDDHSTDSTLSIAQAYAARHKEISVYSNEGPQGINGNFHSAMLRTTGTLIALCDQDDIWEPLKLEHQVEAIGQNLLCACRSVAFSSDGFPITPDHRRPNDHILRMAYIGVYPGHTLLLRRELLDLTGPIPKRPYLYDWQLQLVAAATERVAFVDEPLVHFRRHAQAATATKPAPSSPMSRGAVGMLITCAVHHERLQNEVSRRFRCVEELLQPLPYATRARSECLEMARLQTRRGLGALTGRISFFLHHREAIAYAKGGKTASWLRAAAFALTCGYYYRGVLRKNSPKP